MVVFEPPWRKLLRYLQASELLIEAEDDRSCFINNLLSIVLQGQDQLLAFLLLSDRGISKNRQEGFCLPEQLPRRRSS